jgi:SEC-C motif domain protein
MSCTCNSGKSRAECCGPYLEGDADAPTPEALMRSRYSAFCDKNLEYVEATTDPQALSDFDRESTKAWMDGAQFTKLEVLKSSMDGNKGMVEFKAYFTMEGKPEIHHEISKFRKQSGIWYFRDGKVLPAAETK